MQLRPALAALAATVVFAAVPGVAAADGELVLRGVYYKERATRVIPPIIDGRFAVGDSGEVAGHFLVDAITSASVAAGATDEPFSESRVEGGLGYSHTIGIWKVGGRARFSTEPDYDSAFGLLDAQVELADRNFTIGTAFAYGHDDFNNHAGGIVPTVSRTGVLDTYLASLSLTQLLSRNSLAILTYDLIYLDGTQHNLYRVEGITGTAHPENHPTERTRHAIAGTVKWFVPSLTTTLIGTARYYFDDWGLHAFTPELRAVFDINDDETMWLTGRYRFHRQTEAYFYEERYPMLRADMLVSDDTKLAAFDTHTIGVQLELTGEALGMTEGRAATTRAQVVLEYYAQDNAFGNALIGHVALTIPFDY